MNEKKELELKQARVDRNFDLSILGLDAAINGIALYMSNNINPLAPVGYISGGVVGTAASLLIDSAKKDMDKIQKMECCPEKELRHLKTVKNLKFGTGLAILCTTTVAAYELYKDIPGAFTSFLFANANWGGTAPIIESTVEEIKKIKEIKKSLNKKD